MQDWRIQRDRLLFSLEHERSAAARAEAAEALCDLAADVPEAITELSPALARLLGDAQEDVRCAGLALAPLILAAEEAAEILVPRLADPSVRVRLEAAGRLADLALPSTRGALAEAMRDEAFLVRFEAARGIAALQHSAGLEVLIEALQQPDLRFRALGVLAELGDARALPAVQRVFRKWLLSAFERTQAAGALARLGDPEGGRYLLARTRKKWSADRAMAIELLGEVKAEGAYERLSEILCDPADPCRGAAARGLGRLGDVRAIGLLVPALQERAADLHLDAAEGLCLLGSAEGRQRVEEALASASEEERRELAAILEEHG